MNHSNNVKRLREAKMISKAECARIAGISPLTLDRIERGSDVSAVTVDPRLRLLRDGIQLLAGSEKDRAARMQMHFSDAYIAGWRNELAISL
jgi:DNA-binding XRE family transcriptional regulator